eukprot:COSAG02_NODE_4576_length_5201_cov_4.622109_4_plen_85_part_00
MLSLPRAVCCSTCCVVLCYGCVGLALNLGAGLGSIPGLEVEPVLANEVFIRASPAFVQSLRALGHAFLDFSVLGTDLRRFRLGQ